MSNGRVCATQSELASKVAAVKKSRLSIYDLLDDHPELFYTVDELEQLLGERLAGLSLAKLPLRTRSKKFKSAVCEALGYPIPASFQKTQPRFPGQDFDTYVQKADNLQIWNEEVAPTRRYVLARPDSHDVIEAVRVVTGEALAELDKTGTLTKKYQARRKEGHNGSVLVNEADTTHFRNEFEPENHVSQDKLGCCSPTDKPKRGCVLSIASVHRKLMRLVGTTIDDPGHDQERNRGAGLQRAVCKALNLADYADKGQWPDILSQAVEVKLQTAPTVDLGLVSPDGTEPAQEVGKNIRHRDIRYAVFYGDKVDGNKVKLTALVTVSGKHFFDEFNKFGGKIVNAKLQIPLPGDFFD
ncbi:MAG TPA: hypothetical protein VGS27_20650 [Candidatus Sulfotelmatobacter sp.]|nr:hypothetical protein [Candidatus Sulfotelmatobacter sp.]